MVGEEFIVTAVFHSMDVLLDRRACHLSLTMH